MKNTLACLLLFLLLLSCDKENTIRSGVETRVSGRVTDHSGVPIADVKVKIGEFRQKNGSLYVNEYFERWIDSSSTNSNGEYDFLFKTTGKGSSYTFFLANSPIDEQHYWGGTNGIPIMNLGGSFTFSTNQFFYLYPCDITFNATGATGFPLYISHDTTFFSDENSRINSGSAVAKRIYISKYYPQTVTIMRAKTNGTMQKATYSFPASNAETLTTQSITINETDFVDI
ncbi:carboxypeptidase-like regulatory domain-containing protein [Flavobacterium humi]|uniref:Uncharacterized protein n=1 Tax=Flavobacterium humi TaxID=2562683 RepID=A0A4Z0LBW0_9FLAO|nr:hypothetical protein [Flavobacterium humi]TGD59363.1 hypothetical protein E4635_00040 [Flavobacterium humi]